MLKLGIIREGKTPPDARAALSPEQCTEVEKRFKNLRVLVEPSPVRCFKDEEYQRAGIELKTDLSDCDILLGIKEVPISKLAPGKTYFFFFHTIKKQAHNRKLLLAILEKNIRLIDYEALTNEKGSRLIAFGFYAGVVGSHNGIWAYGQRTGLFSLPRLNTLHDYAAACDVYKRTKLPPLRIVLTGGGRVGSGAVKNLLDMGVQHVSPEDFLRKNFPGAVFTQLHAYDYVRHRDGLAFDKKHFYQHGEQYESTFAPFYRRADIFLNGIFYDPKAPGFFTTEEMRREDFRIQIIADITCDIAPDASVPSTLRASTIAEPIFGFDPTTGQESEAFQKGSVDVMSIDNLPSELPRDASVFFGKQLMENILPEISEGRASDVIRRGTVAAGGKLTAEFGYLSGYVLDSALAI